MGIQLKASVIKNMIGHTDLFQTLAKELGRGNIETVRRWMRANKPNGPLTTKAALCLISESLDMPFDLLTEENNHGTINQRVSDSDPSIEGHECKDGSRLSWHLTQHSADTNKND